MKGRGPSGRWDEPELHWAQHHGNEPHKTHDQQKRIFGAPFVTAGWVVVGVTVIVSAIEIALLVLLLQVAHAS